MSATDRHFLVWRCRRGLWLALASVVLLATLRFGPLGEQSTLACFFAAGILAGLLLFTLAASGRLAFGLVAGCLPMLLLVIAATLKFQYLSTPLLAPDLIYYFNLEIADTLLRYPFIIAAIIATLVLVPAFLIALWRSDGKPVRTRAMRGARLLGIAVALVLLVVVLAPRGPFATIYETGMWQAMNDESFIADFVISIPNAHIEEPAFRPADASRDNWRQLPTPPSTPGATRKPDIVVVLEESTFDPHLLAACTTPICDSPLFQPTADTIAHGWLDVHTWGGGTWTSEFAFMSGLPHTLFGPAGVYAPFNLAPRIRYTLPRLLDADGYRTVGIYPTDADFMNGRDAYADYGFNAFHGGDQLGLDWGATDADVFKAFERVFAEEKAKAGGKPLFVFMLTLYQHGPHMTPFEQMPAPYNKPLFIGKLAPHDGELDQWLNLNLANYLQRLSMSAAAMTQLENFLRHDDRPVLLMHFGDHHPSFDGAITSLVKNKPAGVSDPQYATYYMLKGFNLPIHSQDYPVLDIAYLGSLLLDAAGLPRDPFFTANTLLRDRCHGHDLDCNNTLLRDSYRAWVFGHLDDLK